MEKVTGPAITKPGVPTVVSRKQLVGVFTSAEGGYVFGSVGLFVCLFVRKITDKVVNGF